MEKRERSRWRPRLPFLLAGVLGLLLALFSLFREMGGIGTWKLYKTYRQILAENASLREENQRLQKEVDKLRTNASYIEEIARKELGLVHEKENVIVLERKKENPPATSARKEPARR